MIYKSEQTQDRKIVKNGQALLNADNYILFNIHDTVLYLLRGFFRKKAEVFDEVALVVVAAFITNGGELISVAAIQESQCFSEPDYPYIILGCEVEII